MSKRWKKNRLVANFLRSKVQAQKQRSGHAVHVKKIKATLSLPGAFPTEPTSLLSDSEQSEVDQLDGVDYDSDDSDMAEERTDNRSCRTLINEGGKRKRCYKRTKNKQLEEWSKVQRQLLRCYNSSIAMPCGQVCMECPNRAEFYCRECSATAYYCAKCCIAVHCHNNIFHFPEKWVNSRYVLAPLRDVLLPLNHECLTLYQERITVISAQGQHHGIHISLCGCSSVSERLYMCGLWPATPGKPQLAFTIHLMDLIRCLVLECQVSLHDAVNFLKMTGKSQPEDKEFYELLTVAFPQYRSFKSAVNSSVHTSAFGCPACPKEGSPDPLFMAVDANFRLCRRKRAGYVASENVPLVQPSYFLPQDEVDKYVHSESKQPSLPTHCSDFKAGDVLRSHSRYHALDETAVFGAICQHDIPIRMLSLKHGERLAYADFLLQSVIDQSLLPLCVNLTYDIGCKLESHWKANPVKFQAFLERCTQVAVPIFHVYAHEAACQHKYNPRNLEGFGLVDGENIERLWSYLGRFSRMSKEMASPNRIDVLSDALHHYASLKEAHIEKACVERFSNAIKQLTTAEKDINSTLQTAGLDESCLVEIQHQVNSIGENDQLRTFEGENSWRVKYVQMLENLKQAQQEHSVQQFEVENGITTRWESSMEEYKEALKIATLGVQQKLKQKMMEIVRERIFYQTVLTHHAGGHKQATRVSKLIQACTIRVKKLLVQYSELQSQYNADCSEVTVKDVCNLQSQFWISEHSYVAIESYQLLPASSQRRLMELSRLKQRAFEEKQMVIADLVRVVTSYFDDVKMCIENISHLLHAYDAIPAVPIQDTLIDDNLMISLNTSMEECAQLLTTEQTGSITAVIILLHEKQSKLIRAEKIVQLLVHSYWTNDLNVITEATKIASTRSISVCPLSLQMIIPEPPVPDHMFQYSKSNIFSDSDAQSSTTDTISSMDINEFEAGD